MGCPSARYFTVHDSPFGKSLCGTMFGCSPRACFPPCKRIIVRIVQIRCQDKAICCRRARRVGGMDCRRPGSAVGTDGARNDGLRRRKGGVRGPGFRNWKRFFNEEHSTPCVDRNGSSYSERRRRAAGCWRFCPTGSVPGRNGDQRRHRGQGGAKGETRAWRP